MPAWQHFVDRFRPVGTAGAPGPVGVPADRCAEMSAELEPVLARLSGIEVEAERIRRDAAYRAEARRRAAATEAAAIIAEASAAMDAVRAETAATVRHEELERTAVRDDGVAAEVDRVRELVGRRLPGYVDRAVAVARDLMYEVAGVSSSDGQAAAG